MTSSDRILSSERGNALEVIQLRPWREASALTLLVMDLCWALPLYRMLSRVGRSFSVGSLYALASTFLLGGYLLTRSTYQLRLKTSTRRTGLMLLILVSALAAVKVLLYPAEMLTPALMVRRIVRAFADPSILIPAEFEVILLVLLVWARGVDLAQRWLGSHLVEKSLRFGALAFLFLGLFDGLPQHQMPKLELHLFLLFGLVSMGAGRAAALWRARGQHQYPFDRYWLLGVTGAATMVALVTVLTASLASGPLTSLAVRVTTWAVKLLFILMVLLLSPLLLLILLLLPRILDRLDSTLDLSPLRQGLRQALRFFEQLLGFLSDLLRGVGDRLPDLWPLKPYLLWGGILLGVLLLLRLLGRRWSAHFGGREVQEERQFTLDREQLPHLLQAMLNRGLKRLVEGWEWLQQGGRWLAAARIRRVYAQLMRMCEDLGYPRPSAHTPLEFMPTLLHLLPEHRDELEQITAAYLRVRYGEMPENRKEVAQVLRAWSRVKEQGGRLRQKVPRE